MSISSPVLRFRSLVPVFATALAILALAGSASAQQRPIKDPGGPFVTPAPAGGDPSIEAGRNIEWTVTILNPGPAGVFTFYDNPSQNAPHAVECGAENAPGGLMIFEDTNADGNCNESVTSVVGGTGFTTACDPATNVLEIQRINIGAFGTCTIKYVTLVQDNAACYGQTTCNQAHFLNADTGVVLQSTTKPGGSVPECSCLRIAPPSGFDFVAEKTASIDNGRLVPGDPASTVTYTIRAVNTGTEDIPFGTLEDILPAGAEWVSPAVSCPAPLTCTFGPSDPRFPAIIDRLTVSGYSLLATDPDAELTIQARAKVTCAAATDDDSFVLCNQGEFTINGATFPTDDPALPGPSDATCVPVVWSNLTGTKKIYDHYDDANSNGQLDVGERIHFVIQARNEGRYIATNVVVTDEPGRDGCLNPASVQALDGGTVAGGIATWNVGNLAANGGQANVRVSATLSQDQLCCNQASLNSDERVGCGQGPIGSNDPATPAAGDHTCVSPGPQPNLDFRKTVLLETDADGDGVISAGDTLRWRITVENIGAGAATGADLNDPLPLCLRGFPGTFDVFTTTDGADAGTNNSVPYSGPPAPGSVIINDLGGANGIQPGERIVIEFITTTVTLTQCCNQGTITYAEAVTPSLSDDVATPGLVDDPTCLSPPPPAPRGRLQKTNRVIDTNGDGFLGVGERVEFTLVFTNIGSETLSNVHIVDASQACITLDIATVVITTSPTGIAAVNNSTGNTVTVDLASLAPTESVTIVVEGVVAGIGNCCNQASYTATGSGGANISGLSDRDPSDFTNEEPTCHVAENVPTDTINMSITKTVAESGCQDPGGALSYTVTVASTGTTDVASYRFEDVLDGTMYGNAPIADVPLTVSQADRTGDGVEDYIVAFDDPAVLAVGRSRIYTYFAQLGCSDSGTATNSASVTFNGSTGLPQTRTDTVTTTWGIPELLTTKSRTWADADADGFVDLGEVITYTVTVTNAPSASCAARDVTVTDPLDGSLAGASVNALDGGSYDAGSNSVIWDVAGTPALASIAPGASVTVRFEVQVSASATPGAQIANTVIASPKNTVSGNCPPRDLSTSGSAATVQYDPNVVLPSLTLLRNDFVSCRLTGFATIRGATPILTAQVGGCSNPPRINTAHPQTDSIATPAMPYTAVGDATRGTDSCPQIGAGDGRVLIFYELEESDCAGAIPNLQVSKTGNDVILRW